jgi:hypothetical protein
MLHLHLPSRQSVSSILNLVAASLDEQVEREVAVPDAMLLALRYSSTKAIVNFICAVLKSLSFV